MAKEPTAQENAQRVLREAKERQAEAVRLQDERDQVTPTPTQEEADLIKLGALDIDAKQDSGAPADDPAQASTEPQVRSDAGSRNRQVKTD